jgi:predicted amidohydrolase YtcJ
MTADWVLLNGRIETFDQPGTTAEAMAVADGKVLAVGSDAEIEGLCTPRTRRTNLAGRTVLPGFIDTHMHLEKVSHEFTMLRLENARSVAEILGAVRERAEQSRASGQRGVWIRCFADNAAWNEKNLSEGRLPTREELDGVAPDVPVYLYRRPDRSVINSAGIALMASRLEEVTEGYDPETGYLSGPPVRILNDAIYTLSMADDAYRQDILAQACQRLLALGITTIVDPGLAGAFDSSWALYQEAARRGQLPQRVLLMNRFDWRKPYEAEKSRVLRSSALPGEGEDGLKAWALKFLLDGEFANAWMRDGEDTGAPSTPHYTPDELRDLLRLAAERGWPVCIHAMGGGAIEAVTAAVQDLRNEGVNLAHGQVNIAHAFLMDVPDMQACSRLGIKLSLNPALAYVYSDEMRAAWGPLAARAVPLATLASLGLRFAAGSDTHPCAPLAGAAIAVQRKAWDGSSLGSHEAITPRQALAMFARDAGDYINAPELGHLSVGATADFVLWPQNPLEADPSTWPDLSPDLVVLSGETAWMTPEFVSPNL